MQRCVLTLTHKFSPAEVRTCAHSLLTLLGIIKLYNTGITLTGIQSGVPILIGGSVTINCTTIFSADSIILLQDNHPLYGTRQSSTILTHNIPLVNDSIHRNTFKCVANFSETPDTAFDNVTTIIGSKLQF